MSHSRVNLVGGEEILFQKSLKQNAAHLAGAKHSNADVGQLGGNTLRFYGDIGHVCFLILLFPARFHLATTPADDVLSRIPSMPGYSDSLYRNGQSPRPRARIK